MVLRKVVETISTQKWTRQQLTTAITGMPFNWNDNNCKSVLSIKLTCFLFDSSDVSRIPSQPVFHERLYNQSAGRMNSNDWLTTVLAHDSVPPNIDLSPVDIINGEILHKRRTESDINNRHSSDPRSRINCKWQNIGWYHNLFHLCKFAIKDFDFDFVVVSFRTFCCERTW